jgi:hypothetical protein
MSTSFPGNPKVAYALEKYISRPLEASPPEVPNVGLLEVFQKGLDNFKKHADRRVESSQEAVRVGQETLVQARIKLKGHLSGSKVEPSQGAEDDGRKIKNKEKDSLHRHSSGTHRDVDPMSKLQGERRVNDHGNWGSSSAVKSPVQVPRIKRELSGRSMEPLLLVHCWDSNCTLSFGPVLQTLPTLLNLCPHDMPSPAVRTVQYPFWVRCTKRRNAKSCTSSAQRLRSVR